MTTLRVTVVAAVRFTRSGRPSDTGLHGRRVAVRAPLVLRLREAADDLPDRVERSQHVRQHLTRCRSVLSGAVVGIVVSTAACGGPPPQLEVESMANTACQSVPVGTSDYYSAWVVRGPAGGTERIKSIRLVGTRTSSPHIHVMNYYVQATGGIADFGSEWTGEAIGGISRSEYVRKVGLGAVEGVPIRATRQVNLAVTLEVDGLGVSHWKGMDVTYTRDGHPVTQRIDPAMTIYGVPSQKVDNCP